MDYSLTQTTKQVREAIRSPYAWPGGYPMYLVTSDGAALCMDCGRKEYRQISWSIRNKQNDGWKVDAQAINYENDDLYCDNCNEQIESAYGDPNKEYKVAVHHGEGKTLFYVVKYDKTNDEDWEVVASYDTRELAENDIVLR